MTELSRFEGRLCLVWSVVRGPWIGEGGTDANEAEYIRGITARGKVLQWRGAG